MKTKNKPHFLLMAAIVAVFAAFAVSCNKDDDPSLADLREDKLQYLEDSLRISDSLKRINAAGVVNYAISVVNGSTSSLFTHSTNPGRTKEAQGALDGAIVTISQYGKTQTDTTDASGMVVFTGFFRTTVNVNIRKEGFTTASYAAVVNLSTATANNTISFIGNIIPVFELTGANTATIAGRATIDLDLTNKTREVVPDGTKITASIDAKDASFAQKFLTTSIDNFYNPTPSAAEILDMGEVLNASYQTGVIGSVTGGNYSITVPAAIDGLPIAINYSELAGDQKLFESDNSTVGQRTVTARTIYGLTGAGATLPTSSSVGVTFETNTSPATATAEITNGDGVITDIVVNNSGAGYTTAPVVVIQSTSGIGATATATVANGKVTEITVTNGGSGYDPTTTTVQLRSGSGASATTTLAADGTVLGVAMTNSGLGYTSAPTVTFSAPPAPGTTATANATLDAAGRVTINMLTAGSGYIAAPTVTITVPGGTGTAATATAIWSGNSVGAVTIATNGSYYSAAPTVEFSLPERVGGVRATGVAVVNAATGQVTNINITNAGTGYTNAPTVSIQSGTGATATEIVGGGTVTQIKVTDGGANWTGTPNVFLTLPVGAGNTGSGATAVAVMAGNKVVGVNITNPGSGYNIAPLVSFSAGDGANAYATVTDGSISGINVTDGGRNFTGAPRVVITSSDGSGATATATVANGRITGVTVPAAPNGTGYLTGNTPSSPQPFSATKGNSVIARPGIAYVNDVYYGTGTARTY